MNKANREWLAGELPSLISKGVINKDVANSLSQYFDLAQLQSEASGLSKMTIILASLGGLLVGGGIIMLFAHNWDSMNRWQRMLLALLPLLVSQCLALLALFPKMRGVAWREATAALMFCAVPASIALVGQTYHISDDFQAFQTFWFLLTVPFIYLLRSKLTAVLMMMLATQMSIMHHEMYWLCAFSLLPFYFLKEPYGRESQSPVIGWVFVFGLAISIVASLIKYDLNFSFGLLLLMSGAICIYLLGGLTEARYGFWKRPFCNFGAVAVALNLLAYTFKDFWHIREQFYKSFNFSFAEINHWTILLLFIVALVCLVSAIWKKRVDLLPLSTLILLPLLVLLFPIVEQYSGLLAFGANIISAMLGVWYLWLGIKENSTSRMNFGLLILMALTLMRFFDQDFSFIVKGIAFVIIGSAFIAVNIWQGRRGVVK